MRLADGLDRLLVGRGPARWDATVVLNVCTRDEVKGRDRKRLSAFQNVITNYQNQPIVTLRRQNTKAIETGYKSGTVYQTSREMQKPRVLDPGM